MCYNYNDLFSRINWYTRVYALGKYDNIRKLETIKQKIPFLYFLQEKDITYELKCISA